MNSTSKTVHIVATAIFQTDSSVELILLFLQNVIFNKLDVLSAVTQNRISLFLEHRQTSERKSKLYRLIKNFIQNEGRNSREDFLIFLKQSIKTD